MKSLFIFILLSSFNARASDFVPTNFTGTKEEVRDLFSRMWGDFKDYDNFHCYRRAHVLSYQLSKMNINSMKVFFFKGESLTMPKDWYYHVAPMIYYHGEGVVMDKGLFKGATTLKDWLFAFGEGKPCLEVRSMEEKRSNSKTQHCMYMIVPMYYYGPLDLEVLSAETFHPNDLSDMLISLPRRQRGNYETLYPLEAVL
jgi:hypothetical protein